MLLIKYAAIFVLSKLLYYYYLRYYLDWSVLLRIWLYLLDLVYIFTFARIYAIYLVLFLSFSIGDFFWGIIAIL